MARQSKTGGGVGTNQYKIRGQAKATGGDKRPKEVCGHPADQVIKRGNCVWLRATFDDIWCLKHRQLAPELRQLAGLVPCVVQLEPDLQMRALGQLSGQAAQWISPELRLRAARCLPPGELGWAPQDEDWRVRKAAAERMPEDELDWATQDENERVRLVAAWQMPEDELQWATRDQSPHVRAVAADQMSPSQLEWATKDQDWDVRSIAAQRMPEDQLQWATKDPYWEVRKAAAERMPEDELDWATQDENERVRQVAAWRLSGD